MDKELFNANVNEGCAVLEMAQKMDGKKIALKLFVDQPYDWDSMKSIANTMIDALKKYREDLTEYKKCHSV